MTEEEPTVGFTPRGDETDDIVDQLNDHAREHQFLAELEIEVESVDDGVLRASVPHDETYANPGMNGTLHGGIVVSVLDSVMGFTLMAALGKTESRKVGPTISLTTNFVSAATEGFEAVGEIVRIGASTAVIDGKLIGRESDRVIATGQGVWRVYDGDN